LQLAPPFQVPRPPPYVFKANGQEFRVAYAPVADNSAMFGGNSNWFDLLLSNEFFDGETGRGLGASHQTGWTALVAR
jgi:hypothetical protein